MPITKPKPKPHFAKAYLRDVPQVARDRAYALARARGMTMGTFIFGHLIPLYDDLLAAAKQDEGGKGYDPVSPTRTVARALLTKHGIGLVDV